MNDENAVKSAIEELQIKNRVNAVLRADVRLRIITTLGTLTSFGSSVFCAYLLLKGTNGGRAHTIGAGVALAVLSIILTTWTHDMFAKRHRVENITDEIKTRINEKLNQNQRH